MVIQVDDQDVKKASDQLWQILVPHFANYSEEDQEVFQLAFMQMVEAHGEQRRKSGQFYIVHPVSATITLADIGLDRATIAACLLHDVPEDTEVGLDVIEKNFGGEIAFLVSGITKLGSVKYRGNKRYAENLRKMFIAMTQDLRVIFIKLADRIHNLQTLHHLRPDKAHRIALESLTIYSRIAERLGMVSLQGKIEDLVFPILYPEKYNEFVEHADIVIEKRRQDVGQLKQRVQGILEKNGITDVVLKGRAKRYYSIYNKMVSKNYPIENILDLVALRVITTSVDDCYHILSIFHGEFEPVPGRMKDYIDKPKQNGYQSLHSSIKDSETGAIFELQIRTQAMHDFAEYGAATHWAYKDQHNVDSKTLNLQAKWIQELVDLGAEPLTDEEYLERVRLDLYQDRIFVMTPGEDAINLPAGATSIDFAFRIHEELGMKAVMAKVNGVPQKLSVPLNSGDIVEIISDKKQEPNPDWLNCVATVNAARKIRARLRKLGYHV